MATMESRLTAAILAIKHGDGTVTRYEFFLRPSTVPGHTTKSRRDVEVTGEVADKIRQLAIAGECVIYHDGVVGVQYGMTWYRITLSRPGYESSAYRRAIGTET